MRNAPIFVIPFPRQVKICEAPAIVASMMNVQRGRRRGPEK
jgi:hypothetical protein